MLCRQVCRCGQWDWQVTHGWLIQSWLTHSQTVGLMCQCLLTDDMLTHTLLTRPIILLQFLLPHHGMAHHARRFHSQVAMVQHEVWLLLVLLKRMHRCEGCLHGDSHTVKETAWLCWFKSTFEHSRRLTCMLRRVSMALTAVPHHCMLGCSACRCAATNVADLEHSSGHG